MRLVSLAACLALLAGCAKPAPAPTNSAAAAVDSLYRIRQPFQGNGAPTATELASMSPWLSAELKLLLARADSLRSAEAAAAPSEKPSFAEGDLFSSLFEGPTSFETDKSRTLDSTGSAKVAVHFSYSGATPAQTWTDTVVVITEGGKPVVSDVLYGGTWDFANKGSLVTSLNFSFVPTGSHEGPK